MKTLVALPSQRTVERLKAIYMSAPLSVDFDNLAVVLAHVDDSMLPEPGTVFPEAVHRARVTDYGIRTDELRLTSELVAVLESSTMRARATELGMSPDFQIKLVIVPYTPAHSQAVRNFNVSIADILVLHETEPFTFLGEGVL